ncbi:TPA: hypothetical protein ACGO2X_001177 [Streptococcus suis]
MKKLFGIIAIAFAVVFLAGCSTGEKLDGNYVEYWIGSNTDEEMLSGGAELSISDEVGI